MAEFIYQEPFPLSEDTTEYRLLTKDYVKTVECDGRQHPEGRPPRGLELLAREAIADVSFYLQRVAPAETGATSWTIRRPPTTTSSSPIRCCSIRRSPAEGELPTCQDTGTAIVIGKKGEDVYTGCNDAEMPSRRASTRRTATATCAIRRSCRSR